MSQSNTQIVLLGTGTPIPGYSRAGPSLAIIVNGTPYLVDTGRGIVDRAVEAFERGIEALCIRNLKHAFITHLHSDHTVGYPDLILTPWTAGRKEPLEVYGPKGIEHMTKKLLSAYEVDIKVRMNGHEMASDKGVSVNVHEIVAGKSYHDEKVDIEAFPVDHCGMEAFGYKFHTLNGVIVISGDTRPNEDLVKKYGKCDVLIHEVYSEKRHKDISLMWQKALYKEMRTYYQIVHTSSKEVAEIASKVKPKLLILVHQLLSSSDEQFLQEIRGVGYKGEVFSGKDLDVFEFKGPKTILYYNLLGGSKKTLCFH